MLKPYLKRNQPLNIDKNIDSSATIIPQQTRTYTSVAPSIFVTDYWSNFFKEKKNYWSILHTQTITIPSLHSMMLNEQSKIDIECRYIWCIQSRLLVIWNYEVGGNITEGKKYVFDAQISAVHIRQMRWNSQKQKITVVAISFGNMIHLFQHCEDKLHPLQIIISPSAFKILSLVICTPEQNKVHRKSILFVDNQGYLGGYDIEINRKMQTKSITKLILNQFINTNNGSQVLDIKSLGDKVFTLIKVDSSQKISTLMKMMGIKVAHQEIIIKIYTYNENGLKHRSDITSQMLTQKLKQSFQDFFTDKIQDLNFQIHSIHPFDNYLQIIFECGYIIHVQDTTNVTFTGQLYCLPKKPTKMGIVVSTENGQSIVKKLKLTNYNAWIMDKEVITQFNNKYSYSTLEDNQQPIKITKILQNKIIPKFRSLNRWGVLLKKSVKILIQLNQTDILLIISYIYCQLVRMHELTQYINDRINSKLKSMMVFWGDSQMMVSIIELLSWGRQYYIEFQSYIYDNLKSQLTDISSLKEQNKIKGIHMNQDIEEYLWTLIFRFHNKKVVIQSLQVQNSDVLWNALMIITTELISHIRDKPPIFFIQNQMLITDVIHRIQCFTQIVDKIKTNYFQKYSKEEEEPNNLNNKWQNNLNNKWQNNLQYQKQPLPSTTSTIKLIQTILLTLPKIKTLIVVYQTLAEYKSQLSHAPTIQSVIQNRQARIDLAKILVQCFQKNNDMVLDRIEEELPDLELKIMRIQRLWSIQSDVFFQRIKDLSEQGAKEVITSLLNVNNLKKVRQFFLKELNEGMFMQILCEKIIQLNKQIFKIDKIQRQILTGDVIDKIDKIALQRQKQNIQIEKKQYIEVLKSSNYENQLKRINKVQIQSFSKMYQSSLNKRQFMYTQKDSKNYQIKCQSILKDKFVQQSIMQIKNKNKKNSINYKYD